MKMRHRTGNKEHQDKVTSKINTERQKRIIKGNNECRRWRISKT